MASYYNTDLSFYGNYLSGLASPGLYQSWQTVSPTTSYLGASAYQPDLLSLLPATASGFLKSYVPELASAQGLAGSIPQALQEQYQSFLTGGSAYESGAAQNLALQFVQDPVIQKLIQQQELRGESALMSGTEMGNVLSLTEAIQQQMGTSGSRLANIYGGLGLETGQIETDIRNMLSGQWSGLGDVFERLTLGGRGMASTGSRQSLLAQLFGNQMLQLGEGQVFNPFSVEIEPNLYQTQLGRQALQGEELLGLTSGLLSTQNLDITAPLATALQRATQTGAPVSQFGGPAGYRVTSGIADIADLLQQSGGRISQTGGVGALGDLIDLWFKAGLGKSQGRGLYEELQAAARSFG
jgi:hypothetical protein